MSEEAMKTLLTTEEVAEICRTTASTVRYWRHLGTGPRGAKVGRRVLYRRGDVEAWIESQFAAPVSNTATPGPAAEVAS